MRCPKCGFISYDSQEQCGKCGKSLAELLEKIRGTGLHASPPNFLLEEEAESEVAVEVMDAAEEEAAFSLETAEGPSLDLEGGGAVPEGVAVDSGGSVEEPPGEPGETRDAEPAPAEGDDVTEEATVLPGEPEEDLLSLDLETVAMEEQGEGQEEAGDATSHPEVENQEEPVLDLGGELSDLVDEETGELDLPEKGEESEVLDLADLLGGEEGPQDETAADEALDLSLDAGREQESGEEAASSGGEVEEISLELDSTPDAAPSTVAEDQAAADIPDLGLTLEGTDEDAGDDNKD